MGTARAKLTGAFMILAATSNDEADSVQFIATSVPENI